MSNNENLIRFPQKNSKKAEKALNEVSLRNQLKHAKVVVFSLLLKGRREHLREFSVKFRRLWKIIGNPRKPLGRFRKSRDHGKAKISRI